MVAIRLPARREAIEPGNQAGKRVEPGDARRGMDDSGHDGASWCDAAIAASQHKVAGGRYVKGPDRFADHTAVSLGRMPTTASHPLALRTPIMTASRRGAAVRVDQVAGLIFIR